DRPLFDAVAEHVVRGSDRDSPAVSLRLDAADATDAVHVPLNVVTAERLTGQERGLEVDLGPECLRTSQRLGHDVERELPVRVVRDGQADAVDRDRVADRRL